MQLPELPEISKRIKKIILDKADGKILRFVKLINDGLDEPIISQQRLDRLFHVDKKTGKYPSVSFDVLEAIVCKFEDVDAHELITGQKKSGADKLPDNLLTRLRNEIDVMRASLLRLADLAPSVQEESSGPEVTYDHSEAGKSQ